MLCLAVGGNPPPRGHLYHGSAFTAELSCLGDLPSTWLVSGVEQTPIQELTSAAGEPSSCGDQLSPSVLLHLVWAQWQRRPTEVVEFHEKRASHSLQSSLLLPSVNWAAGETCGGNWAPQWGTLPSHGVQLPCPLFCHLVQARPWLWPRGSWTPSYRAQVCPSLPYCLVPAGLQRLPLPHVVHLSLLLLLLSW